jgi:RNase P subunit RPR2
MNGYCTECDMQILFSGRTVTYHVTVNGDILVSLRCPSCEESELITIIEL